MKANEKLMAFRKDRRWSQRKMAEVLSVDPSYVSKFEGGQPVSVAVAWKMIDVFSQYGETILLSELIGDKRDTRREIQEEMKGAMG